MQARQKSRWYLVALGGAVQAARKRRGLSQAALEGACNLDRSYLSGIERGVRNPTVKTLLRVAGALRTTPAALLQAAEANSRGNEAR